MPLIRPQFLFVLALVSCLYFFIQVFNHPDKSAELIVTIVGTFLAAWAGGWAAFSAERKTREDMERKTRISAANKALYTISIMFNLFDNFRQAYIDNNLNIRQDENRTLLMDSPQPGMMQKVHFDFDSITYFLDQDGDVCPMVLVDLQSLDWHFQMVLNTVEMRAQAMDELRILTNAVLNINQIKTVHSTQYIKLKALTDTLIELIDKGIDTTRKVDASMRKALQLTFPSQDFLQVKFAEKPLST